MVYGFVVGEQGIQSQGLRHRMKYGSSQDLGPFGGIDCNTRPSSSLAQEYLPRLKLEP